MSPAVAPKRRSGSILPRGTVRGGLFAPNELKKAGGGVGGKINSAEFEDMWTTAV